MNKFKVLACIIIIPYVIWMHRKYERKTGKIWTRDKEEFLSPVDKDKYPNVTQKYRFEEIEK